MTKEEIKEKYKPYKLLSKNDNIFIIEAMEGKMVCKNNTKINYQELYNYLYSRGFSYVPKLIDTNNNSIILEYQDDININNYLKSQDLIKLTGLLHNKTSYYKEITKDTYKEIYDNLKSKISYLDNYYNNLYDSFIKEEYIIPSHYLYLRNYSLLNNALKYSRVKLDDWYKIIEEKSNQRVSLLHNNLELSHLIKNNDEYLISWDNYTIDSPVLDLYKLYKNEWMNINFEELLDIYDNYIHLDDSELTLLYIIISIPYEVKLDKRELDNCKNLRTLINYIQKSEKVISKAKEA